MSASQGRSSTDEDTYCVIVIFAAIAIKRAPQLKSLGTEPFLSWVANFFWKKYGI